MVGKFSALPCNIVQYGTVETVRKAGRGIERE